MAFCLLLGHSVQAHPSLSSSSPAVSDVFWAPALGWQGWGPGFLLEEDRQAQAGRGRQGDPSRDGGSLEWSGGEEERRTGVRWTLERRGEGIPGRGHSRCKGKEMGVAVGESVGCNAALADKVTGFESSREGLKMHLSQSAFLLT